jgi:hypothetical protein
MNALLRPIAFVACVFAFACTPHPAPGVKELTPEQAAPLIAAGAHAVDANVESFRKDNGVIPGAVLLSSSSQYAMNELPASPTSPLIFYCSNRL